MTSEGPQNRIGNSVVGRNPVPWIVIWCFLVELLVLLPVLSGRFYADDWQFQYDDPSREILGAFGKLHPYLLYRPIELCLVSLSLTLSGSTWPVHVLNIALHAVLIGIVVDTLRCLGAPARSLAGAAIFMTVSQLNAFALGSNDTVSLVVSSVAGVGACRLAFEASRAGRSQIPSIVLYAVSLFGKESGLGYAPLLLAMPFVAGSHQPRRPLAVLASGVTIVTVGYLQWRTHLGGVSASVDEFGSPLTTMINVIGIWVAGLVPVRTLDVFTGIVERRFFWPALAGAATIALVAWLAVCIVRSGRWRWALAAVAAGTIMTAPVLVRGHVSELYGYSLLPIGALLIGMALWPGGRVTQIERHAPGHLLLAAGAVVLVALNVSAQHQNANDMARNGEIAAPIMSALVTEIQGLPTGNHAVFIDAPTARRDYCVYRMSPLRLSAPEEAVRIAGRPDVRAVRSPHGTPIPAEAHVAVFQMDENLRITRIR